jgi:hypothetical protein
MVTVRSTLKKDIIMEKILMTEQEEQKLIEESKKDVQQHMETLQPLLDEYEFTLALDDIYILREREMYWWGNEDIECILELAKILKFFNLCGEGNEYGIKSTILNNEANKIKGWPEEVRFKSPGVYRLIYNELSQKLAIFYDYNIFSSDNENDDLEENDDMCEFKSDFECTYGELCFFSNEELDIIIEEYEYRKKISPDEYGFMGKHKGESSARLGKIASMICRDLNDKGNFGSAKKVKQYSFIYDVFVLYGLISDECGKGHNGYIGKEKYQCVKNWINAYKTFKQKIEPYIKERMDKLGIDSQ